MNYINDYGSFEYDYSEEVDDECEAETKSEATSEEAFHLDDWFFTSKWPHYFW